MPAGALAAETGAEAPTAEPAPAPEGTPPVTAPGSTGWVPQTPSTGTSGGGSAPTQHGSSLGSGGSSQPAESTSDDTSSGSSGTVEPETSPPPAAPVAEEPASEPRAGSPRVEPVEPLVPEPEPAPVDKGGIAGLGAATLVARPEAGTVSSAAAVAAPVLASTRDQGGSGSGVLPVPILILCGLFLLYAGARLVLGPVEPDLFRSRRFRFLRRAFYRT